MLTKDVDIMPGLNGSNGNAVTSGNDLIIAIASASAGTSATLNLGDDVNGGDGIDTLRVISDLITAIPLAAVSNVEIIEVRSASAGTGSIDTSAKAGVTNLNITSATDGTSFTATAAATTDVSVSGGATPLTLNGGKNITVTDATADMAITIGGTTLNAGTITVTDSKQGTGNIAIDGGTDVTVTATANQAATPTGNITVGQGGAATDLPTGAVVVTQNTVSDATAAITAGNVTVTGGSTITINANSTNTATAASTSGLNVIAGTYTATAGDTTTEITVKQAHTATSFAGVAGTGGSNEKSTVTFGALAVGEKVAISATALSGNAFKAVGIVTTADDLVFTATKAMTAEQVAAAFAQLTATDIQAAGGVVANGYFTGTLEAGWISAAAAGAKVTFTATVPGNPADLVVTTRNGVADSAPATKAADFAAVTTATVAASGAIAGKTVTAATASAVVVNDNATASVTKVTVDGYTGATIGAGGSMNALTNLSLANGTGTAALTTTQTALNLTVNKVAGTVNLGASVTNLTVNANSADSKFVLSATGVTTATVNAAAALDLSGGTFANVETVTVTGTGNVNLGNISAQTTKLTSTSSGGVIAQVAGAKAVVTTGDGADTISVTGAMTKAISLGGGDDTLAIDNVTTPTAAVDGGTGVNTLAMSSANAMTAASGSTFAPKFTNFQKLSLGAVVDAATDNVNLANLNNINYVISAGSALGASAVVPTAAKTDGVAATSAEFTTYTFSAGLTNGQAFTVNGVTVAADTATYTSAQVASVFSGTVVAGLTKSGTFTTPTGWTGTPVATGGASTLILTNGAVFANVADLTTAATAIGATGTGTLALTKMANNGTLELTGAGTGATVTMLDATSGADTFNIVTKLSTHAISYGTVTVADVETIGITTTDTEASMIQTASLTLAADKATTVNLFGNAALNLTLAGSTAVTLVDGSTHTGALIMTANNGAAAGMELCGGDGADVLTTSGNGDVIVGNGGADQITVAIGDNLKIIGGAGADKFTITGSSSTDSVYTVFQAAVGDTTNVGVTSGDQFVLNSTVSGQAIKFVSTAITLSVGAAPSSQAFIAKAIQDLGVDEMGWFQYGGNTFIVREGNTNTLAYDAADGDQVVMIVGLVDLGTGASYNATSNILEIV